MQAMSELFNAKITREQRITIRVALSLRIDDLKERRREDQTPEGQEMWPRELAAAQDALAAICGAVEQKE